MYTLIKNAHIVSPDMEIASGNILVADGKIIAVSAETISAPAGAEVIDAQNMMTVPGFIDVHCHGRNNFDFCDGNAAGTQLIAENKLAEGVTTLLPTTLTVSEEQLAASLAAVAACDQTRSCRIPGVHLEGPYINPKCAGAQNPAFVRQPDTAEVDRLNAIYPVAKITYAVEMPGGAEFTSAMLSRGITPSCTHSGAKYSDFLAAHQSGLRNLSHFCNQMTPLHHRDIGLVGAGLLHRDVFAELICDKLHIDPAMIKLVFQTKGAEHVILITDAMRAAGEDVETSFLGSPRDPLPVIVEDGVAKLCDRSAFAGSVATQDRLLRNMLSVGVSLSDGVAMLTHNPIREHLPKAKKGMLLPDYDADLCLFDKGIDVKAVLVGGEYRHRAE